MRHTPHLLRASLGLAALSATIPASAVILEFSVTGTVTSVNDSWDFILPIGFDIPAVGDDFLATFKFDTAASLTDTTIPFATYGSALMDAVFSLPDSGLSVSADTAPVREQNNTLLFAQGETDIWEADLFDGTGLTVPALPYSDTSSVQGYVTTDSFSEFLLRLEDYSLADIFSGFPPPLVRPDDAAWDDKLDRTFRMAWGADPFTGNNVSVGGTIDSISVVPEPAATTVLASLGVLGFLAFRCRRKRA